MTLSKLDEEETFFEEEERKIQKQSCSPSRGHGFS